MWCRMLLWMAGAKVEATITEPLDPDRPYVFVSNHMSHLDVPSLFVTLNRQLSFMAKRSLMFVPIFGTGMYSVGVVIVNRKKKKQARASVDYAAQQVAKGRSVFVFAEGGRSRDGRIGEFKKGAFILAIKAQVPLVPVRIEGSRDILPRGSISPRPGTIRVTVFPPISTDGLTVDDRDMLLQKALDNIIGGDTGNGIG